MGQKSFAYLSIAAILALCGTGCNSTSNAPDESSSAPASAETQAPQEHHADMEKIAAAMAKLSSEDRASAEEQRGCPVSGEMLGTMGPPVKVSVNDEVVWICCNGCKDKLLASPEEYLAKMKDD